MCIVIAENFIEIWFNIHVSSIQPHKKLLVSLVSRILITLYTKKKKALKFSRKLVNFYSSFLFAVPNQKQKSVSFSFVSWNFEKHWPQIDNFFKKKPTKGYWDQIRKNMKDRMESIWVKRSQ